MRVEGQRCRRWLDNNITAATTTVMRLRRWQRLRIHPTRSGGGQEGGREGEEGPGCPVHWDARALGHHWRPQATGTGTSIGA